VREADNLPPYSADVKKSRCLNSPSPLWACVACNGCAFTITFHLSASWQKCFDDVDFYEIWVSSEALILMGCRIVLLDSSLPMFQECMPVPSS
jgi:hypothetical protein